MENPHSWFVSEERDGRGVLTEEVVTVALEARARWREGALVHGEPRRSGKELRGVEVVLRVEGIGPRVGRGAAAGVGGSAIA